MIDGRSLGAIATDEAEPDSVDPATFSCFVITTSVDSILRLFIPLFISGAVCMSGVEEIVCFESIPAAEDADSWVGGLNGIGLVVAMGDLKGLKGREFKSCREYGCGRCCSGVDRLLASWLFTANAKVDPIVELLLLAAS